MRSQLDSPVALSDVELARTCRDLHANPELSFQEVRTARVVADMLRRWGDVVTTGIGSAG